MGRFLTEAELRELYGDALVNTFAAEGGAGFAEATILDAEDEALGFLRGHTDIPSIPEETSRRLKVLVGQLAAYGLYRRRKETPFRFRDERENALKALAHIRSGELSIATPAAPTVSTALPAVLVRKRDPDRDPSVISLANMRDWGPSR